MSNLMMCLFVKLIAEKSDGCTLLSLRDVDKKNITRPAKNYVNTEFMKAT